MTPRERGNVYKIDLPKRVSRQLDKIPNKDYPPVSKAIKSLEEIPRPSGCKKLHESLYRIRIGDFRVVYWIDDKNRSIIITKVERRTERTYKRL